MPVVNPGVPDGEELTLAGLHAVLMPRRAWASQGKCKLSGAGTSRSRAEEAADECSENSEGRAEQTCAAPQGGVGRVEHLRPERVPEGNCHATGRSDQAVQRRTTWLS